MKSKVKRRKNLLCANKKAIHNNYIVNLTDNTLNEEQTKLLHKGLKFIPTPTQNTNETLLKSYKQYRRQMYLKYHFRKSSKGRDFRHKRSSTIGLLRRGSRLPSD